MNKRGFSMVELLVGIAVVSAMLAVAGIQFVGWQRKYNTERQIKALHADLMTARTLAKTKNRQFTFVYSAGSPHKYDVYEDVDNDGAAYPDADDKRLEGISKDYTGDSRFFRFIADPPGDMTVDFNRRGLVVQGLVNNPPVIYLDKTGADREGQLDCVTLQRTRINMGKWNGSTTTCETK